MKTLKGSIVARGWGKEGMNSRNREDFLVQQTILYDTIMTDTCHLIFVKTYRMYNTRVSPNVNQGLWVLMLYHVGSLVVTKVPLWCGILTVRLSIQVWGLCTFCSISCDSKSHMPISI